MRPAANSYSLLETIKDAHLRWFYMFKINQKQTVTLVRFENIKQNHYGMMESETKNVYK